MEQENHTTLPLSIARTSLLYRDLMLAIVVSKASFGVTEKGTVELLQDQLPINDDDLATPFGSIDADGTPIKEGCDLAALGLAFAPGKKPTTRMEVGLDLGDLQRRLVVFGDRSWQRAALGFTQSAPQPFVEMPLTYERAYGGRASAGDFETAHADNPDGAGFVYLERDVPGVALPNIEEADSLIRAWDDRPLPAGVAPLPRGSAIRLARGADVDMENGVTRLKPAMFSSSHPRMLLPRYPAGQLLRVRGMTEQAEWGFELPAWHAWIQVSLGDRQAALALVPDTICVFPSYSRFFVVARRAFVYQFVARRQRLISLRWDEMPGQADAPSIAQRLASGDASVPLESAAPDSPIPFELMRELNPLTDIVEQFPLLASA